MRAVRTDRVEVVFTDMPPSPPSHSIDLIKQTDGTFAISNRVTLAEIIAALLRKLRVMQ
jgi:hypothetical protein